jgi:hypothetical protein
VAQSRRRVTLAFATAAIATAGLAYCELHMLKARTPEGFATALEWAHVPIAILVVALAGFAYHYLDVGLRWLAISGIGLRLVSLVLNFTTGVNLNYLEVTRLRPPPVRRRSVDGRGRSQSGDGDRPARHRAAGDLLRGVGGDCLAARPTRGGRLRRRQPHLRHPRRSARAS